jgi:hypothetical protein
MVGTTVGFPIETMEALAPRSRRRIPQKCPQYYMGTYLVHRQVTGSVHSLDGRLRGYYRGLVLRVPRAISYGLKFWI